ncbi:ribosomal N-acetyltransferase [Acrasis kona]|uniref:Ribosomal N-acetyltransferase n=1 Tax=Acrasis kona TaxID=1008807 RepID=A0AAW2ZHR3_9EUKA
MSGEIGYWMAEEFCGKGITTTSTKEVMDLVAFEQLRLKTVELHCAQGNIASRRVAEKLNPTDQRESTKAITAHGETHKVIIYEFKNTRTLL